MGFEHPQIFKRLLILYIHVFIYTYTYIFGPPEKIFGYSSTFFVRKMLGLSEVLKLVMSAVNYLKSNYMRLIIGNSAKFLKRLGKMTILFYITFTSVRKSILNPLDQKLFCYNGIKNSRILIHAEHSVSKLNLNLVLQILMKLQTTIK